MDTFTSVPSSILRGLITLFLFYGLTFQTKATHLIGSDLKYEWVGGNTYDVYFRVYRDCSGIEITPNDAVLVIRMNKCSSPVFSQKMNLIGISNGTPYCSLIGNTCSNGSSRENSQVFEFYLQVNFTTFPNSLGGVQIPKRHNSWYLSVDITARPFTRNVSNPGSLYSETILNNSIFTNTDGTLNYINNSSSINDAMDFGFRFVCLNQEASISLAQFDMDGDSLAYELTTPISSCSTEVIMDGLTSQMISYNGVNYATKPIVNQPVLPSYELVNIPALGGWLFEHRSYFDEKSGLLKFTPMVYFPNTLSSSGKNKYTISY